MGRMTWAVAGALFATVPAGMFAQSNAKPSAPLKAAVDITAEEVQAVLKHTPPFTDRQLRVVDLGDSQLAVGVIHRGPTKAAATAGSGAGAGAAAPAANPNAPPPVPCGQTGGETSGISGLYHDSTVETYIITSGGGTLVTGGHIVNGRRSAPDNQVTTILNGPSCSGPIGGPDIVRRAVKVGDIIIIPANVPHGWTEITDHVTYLSVRPDPDKVLQPGYVHPAIKK